MKTTKTALTFAGGCILGLTLALCLGAVPKPKAGTTNQPPAQPLPTATPAQPTRAGLQFFAYPNGGTGIFDPSTGTIYVYDSDLNRCYLIRELGNLGEPMRRL